MSTVLHIKNMVCPRCVKMVRYVLEHEGQVVKDVTLGKAELETEPDAAAAARIANALQEEGFLLLDDRKTQIVETIKNFVVETVHYGALDEMNENFSTLLSQKLQKDYHMLSKLFSETENTTIEQFIIQQKIEKVKELLVYGELTLSEIAYKLGYSSVAHLSGQFKKVTGLTPSHFKQLKEEKRRSLDNI
ncbi:helix-turn-helix domain-containing protein [Chitinophaga rhizosphaerae]|uniref:helix-turn-helix domain-containing protein n=1 Tax=Chitinophaga rhizosphaerae TaxID=1864947 RepID=UPI0013DFFF56|nr:AraC family transcriptional regulator [Chitinophaga rhizosphaerae]